ncbi:MAG: protein translocase subunit SecF [Chloroflexota bacterium]|nr:protein translocase subunit SecF [Chloroflexota bacterium]
MIDFIGKRRWFFIASGAIILVGLVFMLYSWIAFGSPVRQGIEFSSGSMMTIRFEDEVSQADLRDEMANLGHADAIIQRTGEGDYLMRTGELAPEERDPVSGEVVVPSERIQIEEALQERFGDLTVRDFSSVSPTVSTETRDIAMIAVAVAAVGILLYITWAFRRLVKSFRFGVCAVVALLHDVVIVLGAFSIFGVLLGIEIDAMFVTGILTVIGYSVNNTIVVFDRIRENQTRNIGVPLEVVANDSIVETLPRSLNTGLTTLFVLLALLLFGGTTIRDFVLVLLVGVIIGTYSSMCIAGQLVVAWDRGGIGGLFRRLGRLLPRRAPAGG